MEKKEKIKNVEFLRFLLALVIVFYHFFHTGKVSFGNIFSDIDVISHFSRVTTNGNLAVDMFFIIAGFFMFYTFKNISIKEFFLKKVIRLYPLVLLYSAIDILYKYFLYNIKDYLPHEQILRVLLIDNIGLNTIHSGITWYVSVLFWVSLLYFYCFKYFDKKYLNLIVTVAIVFCYSFLIHATNGNITGHTTKSWYYIFNAGFMRGIAGFGIGYLISIFYNYLLKINRIKCHKFFFTLIECFLLYFIFNNLMFHHLHYYSNFIIILAFIGLFILFLCKNGWISTILDNKLSVMLGRYSYSIFIMHLFILRLFTLKLWEIHPDIVQIHPIFSIIITLICAVILGIFTYHIVEQPITQYVKNKWYSKYFSQ